MNYRLRRPTDDEWRIKDRPRDILMTFGFWLGCFATSILWAVGILIWSQA